MEKDGQLSLIFSGITVFISGIAVMIAELGIVRLAAPIVGGSQPVWAVIISAVLLAIAVGNALGGRLALTANFGNWLFYALVSSGLLIIALPFYLPWLLKKIAFSCSYGLPLALFFLAIPSGLCVFPLGTIMPLLVSANSRILDDIGPVTGNLQALSTAGALCGALVGTFVVTPLLGTHFTFVLCGLLLLFAALPLQRKVILVIPIVMLIAYCSLPNKNMPVIVESSYTTWHVTKDRYGIFRLLAEDGVTTQSYYDPQDSYHQGTWPIMALSPLMSDNVKNPRVYIIGMAGGTTARYLLSFFPGAIIEGSELDPAALDLARDFFALPDGISVTAGDGRICLSRTHGQFDVVLVDAYRSAYVPFHLLTKEFFSLAKDRLQPQGILMLNLLSAKNWNFTGIKQTPGADEGPLIESAVITARQIFSHVYLLDTGNGLNTLLVAANFPIVLKEVKSKINTLSGKQSMRPMLRRKTSRLRLAVVDENAIVLTDDHSPIAWLTHLLALYRLFRKK